MGEILQNDILLVKSIIKKVLDADEYEAVERLGGLTNHTYHVTIKDGKEYVIRLPGEGTQKLINRQNERISTELACKLEVDARLLYFGEDGTKVSEYLPNAVTMSAETLHEEQHIKQVALI